MIGRIFLVLLLSMPLLAQTEEQADKQVETETVTSQTTPPTDQPASRASASDTEQTPQPTPPQTESENSANEQADPKTNEPPPEPDVAVLENLPPVVDYDIRAFLDTSSHKIIATQTLIYTNHSPDLIGDLQFHLYHNGFLNSASAHMMHHHEAMPSSFFGYTHIRSLEVRGIDKTEAIQYIQAPGAPPEDRSVMQIVLDQPLLPGESINLKFDFVTQMTRYWARTQYDDKGFYFAAQWFPKIGVWETAGMRGRKKSGWNCHAKHQQGEFYANFGRYRVALELPPEYEAGATGVKTRIEDLRTTRLHVFEQDRVHDFAFVAGSRIRRSERMFEPSEHITAAEMEEIARIHQIPVEEVRLKPVKMILFLQPEHRNQEDRHFEALAKAIKFYGLNYGVYPYETLTMVDPSKDAAGTGGMEYPTLVTLGTQMHNPKDYLDLEEVIFHEFGHQYWYGMVANNEMEESWLDEGFTDYSTSKGIDSIYGKTPQYSSIGWRKRIYGLDFKIPGMSSQRINDMEIPINRIYGMDDRYDFLAIYERSRREKGRDVIATHSWEYHPRGYGANSYAKPALMLFQLEKELGEETMARVMRTWMKEWQFRHPYGQDFIDVVEKVSGREMRWFFDELLFKAGTLDYKVTNIISRKGYAKQGYELQAGSEPVLIENTVPDTWRHRVLVEKEGNINYPVTIQVVFADGNQILEQWDGSTRWQSFYYDYEAKVDRVVIDPESKLLIDTNHYNNSMLVQPDPQPADRWFTRMLVRGQNLLQILVGGL